jgi:hypothetical protein
MRTPRYVGCRLPSWRARFFGAWEDDGPDDDDEDDDAEVGEAGS